MVTTISSASPAIGHAQSNAAARIEFRAAAMAIAVENQRRLILICLGHLASCLWAGAFSG